MTRTLLDSSAWARLGDPGLSDARADALEGGRIATRMPFLLEGGYSVRNGRDQSELLDNLLAVPHFHVDEKVERRAVDAQRLIAERTDLALESVWLVPAGELP